MVHRKIGDTFADGDESEALALLEAAVDVDGRSKLAAVKLAAGSLAQLETYLAAARVDWRDVVAWAEFPRQMRVPPGEATDEMRASDRADYDRWLGAGSSGGSG